MNLLEHVASKHIRRTRIAESVAHIESLPVDQFVDAIENIDKFVATEKIDGYNLWVGFDAQGLFTSRAGKGGAEYREVDDYPDRPASNGFRAAHQALQKSERILRRHIKEGELVELEILFGRQPNAIVYGDNMIAFLRFVNHTDGDATARLNALSSALSGASVTTSTVHTVTTDGINLTNTTESHKWKFVKPATISSSIIRSVSLDDELAALKQFLNAPSERLTDLTNMEVISANLNTIPKDLRELVKQERERLTAELDDKYRLPIKQKLVDQLLRKIKPSLRTTDVDPSEDFGIEGIVFLDPETNKQFKLIDKDLFTTINKFNFAVRSAIRTTSPGKASPEVLKMFGINRGDQSIMDDLALSVGKIFNVSNDLKYYTIKRTLKRYGDSPQEIIDAVAATVTDVRGAQVQTAEAIKQTAQSLSKMLSRFRKSWSDGTLTLPGGKTMKYTDEVYRRTLTSFAETGEELRTLYQGTQQAKNAKELVTVVFSNQIQ